MMPLIWLSAQGPALGSRGWPFQFSMAVEYLALVMATMVNVGFIEINSCTLKRIEGYDEVAVRGVVYGEMNSLRGSAIPS